MKKEQLRILAAALSVAALVPLPAWADETRDQQWHLSFLNVTEAHRYSEGEGVVVAVIDTGAEADHPDLRGNVLPGTDIVPGGLGNGQSDTSGHGTGMAGLIAAHGSTGTNGALGLAPEAKILPVRIITSAQTGNTADVTRGIEWAVSQGAHVICIPNGGGTSRELLRSIEMAHQNNVVVVAAAGNNPPDVAVLSPARFSGVVAAAAVDRNGDHSAQSVTGQQIVLAAPGVDIVSTSKDGGYRIGSGTSPSSAIIAGAAALVRSKYPDLTAEQVVHRLTVTATDKGTPGRDEQYGYGVLNLVAALTADIPAASPSIPPASISPGTSPQAATRNVPGSPLVVITLATAGLGALVAIVLLHRRRHKVN